MTPDDRDRLRELAERALAQSDPLHVVPTITLAPQRVLALLDDLRDAEAERDRLRAALEWYAAERRWRPWAHDASFLSRAARDAGERARAALADPPAGT